MQCVSRYGGIGLYTLVRVLDNTVLTSVHVCADKWTVIHHDAIKNYDARIVVADVTRGVQLKGLVPTTLHRSCP